MGAKIALYPLFECYRTGRTAHTCPVQADSDNTLRSDLDELQVATICLNRRPDHSQNGADFLRNGYQVKNRHYILYGDLLGKVYVTCAANRIVVAPIETSAQK